MEEKLIDFIPAFTCCKFGKPHIVEVACPSYSQIEYLSMINCDV
jgi:hypothetical protein